MRASGHRHDLLQSRQPLRQFLGRNARACAQFLGEQRDTQFFKVPTQRLPAGIIALPGRGSGLQCVDERRQFQHACLVTGRITLGPLGTQQHGFQVTRELRQRIGRRLTQETRMHQRSHLLAQVQRAELAGVGALAGVLAAAAGVAVGWALARYVFEFAWTPTLWVPLGTAVTGATLALLAGWWGLREVLRRPVVETLRAAVD